MSENRTVFERENQDLPRGIWPFIDPYDDLRAAARKGRNGWVFNFHGTSDKGDVITFTYKLIVLTVMAGLKPVMMLNTVFSITNETTGWHESEEKFYPAKKRGAVNFGELGVVTNYGGLHGDYDEMKLKEILIPWADIDLTMKGFGNFLYNSFCGQTRMGDTIVNHYSVPEMETTGTIILDEEEHHVEGSMWLERQTSDFEKKRKSKNIDDFHSIQINMTLDDSVEKISITSVIDEITNREYTWASILNEDGSNMAVTVHPLIENVAEYWESDASSQKYPKTMTAKIPCLDTELEITTAVDDQEVVSEAREGCKYAGSGYFKGTYKGRAVTGFCALEMNGIWD